MSRKGYTLKACPQWRTFSKDLPLKSSITSQTALSSSNTGVCWEHSCSNHQPRKALPQDQQEDQAVSAAGLRSATMWCWFCRTIQGLGVIEPGSYAYSNCRQLRNTEIREMGFPGMSPINGIQYQVVSPEIIYMQVTPKKTRYIYVCVFILYMHIACIFINTYM